MSMGDFSKRTFFVTSVTWQRRPVFRSERAANMFIDTLFRYRGRGIFRLYEFVIMPDHIHLLLAPAPTLALERVMQFIKGGFSHRFMKRNWVTNGNLGTQLYEPPHSGRARLRASPRIHSNESGASEICRVPRTVPVFFRTFGIRNGFCSTVAKAGCVTALLRHGCKPCPSTVAKIQVACKAPTFPERSGTSNIHVAQHISV